MQKRQYKFSFYLNSYHSMSINLESTLLVHPHTWQLVLILNKKTNDFVMFNEIEDKIQLYISSYEGKLLNDLPSFKNFEPSTENIGEVIFSDISAFLNPDDWELLSLEISENSTRTYIITSKSDNIESTYNFNDITAKPLTLDLGLADVSISLEDEINNEVLLDTKDDNLIPSVTEPIEIDRRITRRAKKNLFSSEEKTISTITESDFKINMTRPAKKYYLLLLIILIISAFITIFLITSRGYYPWGPDCWGHLLKSKVLYDSFLNGNLYPLYTDLWYNGVQPFRYWAPLCYYLLLFSQLISDGNLILAYYIFMGFIFTVGAFGWILWIRKIQSKKLVLILSLLWFFLPDNLSIFLAAGNLPRVVCNTIFPYLFFFFLDYIEERKKRALLGIFTCMFLITLGHLMIAAMTGITLFFYVLWYSYVNKKIVQGFEVIIIAVLGIIFAGLWFYPALKGGMLAMDQDAVLEFTKMLTYPVSESLNPFFRDKNIESFYFGISIFFISLLGFIFSNKKSRVGFGITLLIFLGTTKAFLPFTSKIPMSQMFWMMRFTPLAMASFFTALLHWTKLKKKVLVLFLTLITIDCIFGFKAIGYGRPLPETQNDLDTAISLSTQKVAMLDLSEFGSYPSYYLSYNNQGKKIGQLYGWAFQGAETSPNIVSINSAIEKGWYSYVFDRCLEMGADTLVVKKDVIKDIDKFLEEALKIGYDKKFESEFSYILKLSVDYNFATSTVYDGFGIGKYAVNISYMFPKFEVGKSIYIDDYSESKLSNYKVLYLSGFKYKDKLNAENLIKRISEKGTKVIIDLTGADSDVYSSRPEFLGVISQPVKFQYNFPTLNMSGENINLSEIPKNYPEWNTIYLENLDVTSSKSIFEEQVLDFEGTKINDNIHFIGFNLPFFALETSDENVIKSLEKLTTLKVFDTPNRKLVRINITNGINSISIKSDEKNTILPLANLDAFEPLNGTYDRTNNLILSQDKNLDIKIIYPYFYQGLLISIIGLLIFIVLYVFYFKKLIHCKGEINSNVEEIL